MLVGPSGCGKSTALRMLAGSRVHRQGQRLHRRTSDVTLTPPQDRDIAMVFQNYALYPEHDRCRQHGFRPQAARACPRTSGPSGCARRLASSISSQYLERKPKNLSGGQRQRVAMGRAIVRKPEVFLMDEPLSNLDAKLRVQTRTELTDLQARLGVTTVYVTHDQVEAMTMGHRVAVLKDGVLQQVDKPRVALQSRPANLFVAGFIGSPAMNLIDVAQQDGPLRLGNLPVPITPDVVRDLEGTGGDLVVGIRPEHLTLAGGEGLPGTVTVVEELGSEAFVHVEVEHQQKPIALVVRTAGETEVDRGDNVHVDVSGPTHVFTAGGTRLGA